MDKRFNHYFKSVEGLSHIDVYRVLQLFEVTDPCLQHAIKKLLVAGGRGAKDISKDVDEAIVSLKRWQEMRDEIKGPTQEMRNITKDMWIVHGGGEMPLAVHPDDIVMFIERNAIDISGPARAGDINWPSTERYYRISHT